MGSIKEKAKEWCGNNSNKGCKEPCEGCWLLNHPLGCEQHSMEMAYMQGANYVLECIEESIKNAPAGYGLIYYIIEQLKK